MDHDISRQVLGSRIKSFCLIILVCLSFWLIF
nr:MAG TPA: YycH protein [Caudoviricetes sp.]